MITMNSSRASAASHLLTTGQAAEILGTSRQHVVDLCTTGRLPYTTVGTHRRVARHDVEEIRGQLGRPMRDQLRSLWLHRAVAAKVALDPQRVLRIARRNLERMRAAHPRGRVRADFDEWEKLLAGPLETLLDVLVSKAPRAVELRQNSPFAGVLTVAERTKLLRSFRRAGAA